MASDSFTGADGTLLATHDTNWTQGQLIANLALSGNACGVNDKYKTVAAYYATSTADSSQITIKAMGSSATISKSPAVRMAGTARGYTLLPLISSGIITRFAFQKNGTTIGYSTSGLSYPVTADHTLQITASGTSTVVLTAFIDGTNIGSYNDSSSPITSGSPGFYIDGGLVLSDTLIDDWTDGVSAGFTGIYAASQLAQTQSAAASLDFIGSSAQSQSVQSQMVSALLQFTGSTSEIQAANSEALAAVLGFTGTVSQTQSQQAQAIYQALLAITGSVSQSQAAQIASLTASLAFGGVSAQVQAAQSEALAAVLSFTGATVQNQQAQAETLAALLSFGGNISQAQSIQI